VPLRAATVQTSKSAKQSRRSRDAATSPAINFIPKWEPIKPRLSEISAAGTVGEVLQRSVESRRLVNAKAATIELGMTADADSTGKLVAFRAPYSAQRVALTAAASFRPRITPIGCSRPSVTDSGPQLKSFAAG
jgi:hypothetical protein